MVRKSIGQQRTEETEDPLQKMDRLRNSMLALLGKDAFKKMNEATPFESVLIQLQKNDVSFLVCGCVAQVGTG